MMRNRSVFQQISFRVSFTWNFRSGPEFCVCSSCQPSRVFLEEPEDQLLRQPNRGRWLCVKRLQRGTSSGTEPVTFTTLGWHLLQEGSRSETLQQSQGSIWIPTVTSLKSDLSCQDWVTFFPLWLTLRVAGSTCFNIRLMTQVTLESWETWAAEQASKPIVGETKTTCPL